MINLMSDKYVSSVLVDKPQRDNFPVENLLSNQNKTLSFYTSFKAPGFVVDTFVRPPVTITINFKTPINLQFILLNSKVNAQISNGFIISTSSVSATSLSNYKQISKFLNTKNPDCYDYKFTRRSIYEQTDTNKNIAFFSATPLTLVDRVFSIQVTITSTQRSSQPCLKSLEVYGFEGENSEDLFININEPKATEILPVRVTVPDEFLDDLTDEMMRMPMKLPSNKTVDKSTLDKHSKSLRESKRPDQDPFTCISFSSSHKPVIDCELKSKIDKFLLDNQGCELIYTSRKKSEKRPTEQEELNLKINSSKRSRQGLRSSTMRQQDKSCNCCLNVKSEVRAVYEIITCKHSYCRECLRTLDLVCIVCGKEFENRDLINVDRADLRI